MPGYLYHAGATAMCPHAGQISAVPAASRVMLGGQPATTASDSYPIAGCVFNINGAPHPCVKVNWLQPAARVKLSGKPAVLNTSSGLCAAADQAPQGSPVVTSTQVRVKAI
ncbi:hypothetical protein F183_A33450 [Bryobacterales bacterium F-183]|nr:hypothetical protein F183_A33450 [Bryobacterales bacterium F-183]